VRVHVGHGTFLLKTASRRGLPFITTPTSAIYRFYSRGARVFAVVRYFVE
jgi:hypothetical protein